MVFCHKPYYNPNKKKVLVIYALNSKNYINYIMQNNFKEKHRKFFFKPKFKGFKL